MLEMIAERKHAGFSSTNDLLSSLIDASEKDGTRLTDSDLMGKLLSYSSFSSNAHIDFQGNIFIFLLAGHEVCMMAHLSEFFDGLFNRLLLTHLDFRLHYLHFIRTNRKNCTNTLYQLFLKGPYQYVFFDLHKHWSWLSFLGRPMTIYQSWRTQWRKTHPVFCSITRMYPPIAYSTKHFACSLQWVIEHLTRRSLSQYP